MFLRRAVQEDVTAILPLFVEAKKTMRKQAIPQWQEEYPNEENVLSDIFEDFAWVVEEKGEITGYVALKTTPEVDYQTLQGTWQRCSSFYVTLHRMVVSTSAKRKGVASFLLSELEKQVKKQECQDIRIDTHKENVPMQQFVRKNHFVFCGTIQLSSDGTFRDVFQKILK